MSNWLPDYPAGRTPAELAALAAGQLHVGSMPAIHGRNQWAEAIKAISPAVMQYMRQRQNDQIANQLMNMEQPPRAEAIGYPQGAPATQPFDGGQRGMQAGDMYRQFQEHQGKYDLDQQYREAQIQHLTNPSNRALTEYQQQSLRLRAERENRLRDKEPKASDYISKHGLSVDDLNTPNLIKFYTLDEAGKQRSVSTEEADKLGGSAFAKIPGAKDFIPYDQWKASAESFKRKHGAPATSVVGNGGEAPTTKDTPVQVSTPAEAQALAPGTYYLTPDGKLHKR